MSTTPHADAPVEADRPTVDSRWWYWIAATPVYFAFSFVAGLLAVGVILLGFGFGGSPDAFAGVGILAMLGFLVLALVGMAMLVLFPAALYLDAEAVNDADLDWRPDSTLYALVGAVTAFTSAFALSVAVAGYYLYQRHRHVGVP